MNIERIKELQNETAYPNSVSVQQALLKVWNECEQGKVVKNNAVLPIVSGSYYWVKVMTDDKHEPALAINLDNIMKFQFFNGAVVPCNMVNDYSECNYR